MCHQVGLHMDTPGSEESDEDDEGTGRDETPEERNSDLHQVWCHIFHMGVCDLTFDKNTGNEYHIRYV